MTGSHVVIMIIIIIIIIITNALSWQGFQVNTQNDEKEGVM